jgi:hypothetical protein
MNMLNQRAKLAAIGAERSNAIAENNIKKNISNLLISFTICNVLHIFFSGATNNIPIKDSKTINVQNHVSFNRSE